MNHRRRRSYTAFLIGAFVVFFLLHYVIQLPISPPEQSSPISDAEIPQSGNNENKVRAHDSSPENQENIDGKVRSHASSPENQENIDGKVRSHASSPENQENIDGKVRSHASSPENQENIDGKVRSHASSPENLDESPGKGRSHESFPEGHANIGPSFLNSLSAFDWDGFKEAISKSELNESQVEIIENFQENLMFRLNPFLEMEPRVQVNASCLPPTLTSIPDLKCEGYGNAFTGSQRTEPLPKIGILIQFGFGVDVLEIYLNEVYDVVDQFFIIEATKAHFRTLGKSLMWAKVKDQERFRKFSDKITHLVIDDAEAAKANSVFENSNKLVHEIWEMEDLQETLRWTKFLQWNDAHKFFNSNDLIGFGDADEIPSRERIHLIRHCQLKGEKVDIGIWFPYGHIHQAFATDFPVPGHEYTLGDPTFWTLAAAMEYSKTSPPGRMRGKSGHYILGGMHMTHYGYLPYQLMRDISCTECAPTLVELTDFAQNLNSKGLRALEIKRGATPVGNMKRTVNLTSIADKMKDIAILPWFYDCNRNRYPVWEGGHDTRLD